MRKIERERECPGSYCGPNTEVTNFEIYSIILLVCAVPLVVRVMCKYCIAYLGMISIVIHSLSLVLATIHCDIDKESNCNLHKELVPTLLAHKNGCSQNM